MLALVMCSRSPTKIGVVLWKEHPTLRALIKMVTSNRFRFPTVDCDEDERIAMKAAEQTARDKVSYVGRLAPCKRMHKHVLKSP
jgi:DNA-binding transcriptional MocR family regulator